MFFWKKAEKWHEVRWFNGQRDIYLAMQFADDNSGEDRPTVQRLPSKDPAANAAQQPIDESAMLAEIERALKEYNRMNLCQLRLAGVKYRVKGGANVADHGAAAKKLLNLL
ncbi:hypothetical protein [Humisphaera borealis]|uniref:Uncharacterized protein n=1 Tax=Humisphaera borealis TaxID=2807512 RepID=A0A7M2WZ14_9BACT|nr:hypothetical protein [Humisphaera borealis]QOV90604.1 hypothetical protein IPV69_04365 [Humisphaera borealis]